MLLMMRREDDHHHASIHEEEQQVANEIAATSEVFAKGGEVEGVEEAPDAVADDDDIWYGEPNPEPALASATEPEPEVSLLGNSTAPAESPSEADKNPFIDAYMRSIQPARNVICGQWSECVWDEKTLSIEAPATMVEVGFTSYLFYFL